MDNTIPRLLKQMAVRHADRPAQYSKDDNGDFHPTSYARMYREVQTVAAGLLGVGVKRGSHVGLISDNRKEWFLVDLALLCVGAADVPRGCDSTTGELAYILSFADCEVCFAENEAQVQKVLTAKIRIPALKRLIVFDDVSKETIVQTLRAGMELQRFGELMESGAEALRSDAELIEREIELGKPDDIVTIIFTSGTTGEPKGVMLSHRNFLHQVEGAPKLLTLGTEDVWLCVLPVWHSFERIMQYISLGFASALAYSKPVGKIMLADCQKVRPTWMASVPRIWESVMAGVYRNVNQEGGAKAAIFHFFVAVGAAFAGFRNLFLGFAPEFRRRIRVLDILCSVLPLILLAPLRALGNVLVYRKIKAKLGGRFVAGISGGGALPEAVDRFFSAIGILVLEGYGLTETAPVLGVRCQWRPIPGTIGQAFPGTEIKIVDDEGRELPPGHKGQILARGPQIMLGYYKRPDLTRAILDEQGWLKTGDLGMMTYQGDIKITGRAKDTIVLRGGENVEPAPIESRLRESVYIDQAVLLGQDQKFLAVLIQPNFEQIEAYARDNGIPYFDVESLVQSPGIQELFNSEIQNSINPRNGFKGFELIFRFKVLPRPFELGKELSAKQEVKRHVVAEVYAKEIKELFR